jgi:ferric-dicitrate binding protein FerR (iron transport regulator)
MMTIDHLSELLMKHLQGSLSGPEQERLNEWIAQSERNNRLFASIDDEERLRQLVLLYERDQAEDNETIILSKIRQGISDSMPVAPVRRMQVLRRWGTVAAITLVVAGVGGYFLLNSKKNAAPVVTTETPADIPPARDGAILTLADGSQVVLDSLGNGVIANQNGTQVVLKNGELTYNKPGGSATAVYNNLTTPRGRQFQLILPDGSKAWLNAASSLRYPTVFAGNERRVEVTGEVYFEVAHNKAKPFIINIPARNGKAGTGQLQVLGTRFNVNAYANEAAIRTTLVEGSLKVTAGTTAADGHSVVLKPGQQAQISNATANAPVKLLTNPDVDKAVAWKSGLFNFEDASLEEVMRQLERWYDIEVVYEKGIPDIKFGGKMSNDVSLSGLLRSLQDMEVHFRVEGRKLIVLP